MKRRNFLSLMAKGFSLGMILKLDPAGFGDLVHAQETEVEIDIEALLVDKEGEAFKLSSLEPHQAFVFSYPFASTPNFLVNLGVEIEPVEVIMPDESSYMWSGGIGPDKSIVAYSSICPHAYSYPSKQVGIVNYRAPDVENDIGPRIACCAHLSAFDPSQGGVVTSGPAPHAIAAIDLAYDEEADTATAIGILGNAHYDKFFSQQRSALKDEFGSTAKAKKEVETAVVIPYAEHSAIDIPCPVSS